MNYLKALRKDLRQLADPAKAKILQRFFKTGKGQYGEGDIFLGVVVPKQRILAKKYWRNLSLTDLSTLLKSPIHEERLLTLLILIIKYQRTSTLIQDKDKIYKFYLKHTKWINNWDLVDLSAPRIVGAYLFNKNKTVLLKLAKSKSLWERRIAIITTSYFIYYGRPDEAIKIAEMLLQDPHDLIHKAVGWMLREVGKRCGEEAEEKFLRKYHKQMPRTMLRYALERFPDEKRRIYL